MFGGKNSRLLGGALVLAVLGAVVVITGGTSPESGTETGDRVHWAMCRLSSTEGATQAPIAEVEFGWWDSQAPTATRLERGARLSPPLSTDGDFVLPDQTAPIEEWGLEETASRWEQTGDDVLFWNDTGPFGGIAISQREGMPRTLTATQREPLIDLRVFSQRDSLLNALDFGTIQPTIETDPDFGDFERFESLPLPAPFGERSALVTLTSFQAVPFVLDVWSDDSGAIERVRFLSQELQLRYVEIIVGTPERSGSTERTSFGCPDSFDESPSGQWAGFATWDAGVEVPFLVSLDDDGVPYEVPGWEEFTTVEEPEAFENLVAPNGSLLILDGNILACCSWAVNDPRESVRVEFGESVNELETTRLVNGGPNTNLTETIGFRFDVPGGNVERWGAFETAYGTDGGQGGAISAATAEWLEANPLETELMDEPGTFENPVTFRDVDPEPGMDLLIFANGFGDGAFPMSRGFDESGNLVSLVVFDERRVPWRLIVPDGIAPPDVTDRIDAIAECIAGERTVLADGTCAYDE